MKPCQGEVEGEVDAHALYKRGVCYERDKDMANAIKMYESFGFKVAGTIPKAMHYPDGKYVDEKLMILEL